MKLGTIARHGTMKRHPSKRSCHRSHDGLRTCAASVGAGWSIGARAASIDGLCQFRYSPSVKEVRWHGSSRSDVEAFPTDARREAGYQLFQVQIGEAPSDWKPMTSIGPGVREIRIRKASGAYRIIYIATIGDAVHVLYTRSRKRPQPRPSGTSISRGNGSDRSGDHDGKVCISRPVPGGRSGRA